MHWGPALQHANCQVAYYPPKYPHTLWPRSAALRALPCSTLTSSSFCHASFFSLQIPHPLGTRPAARRRPGSCGCSSFFPSVHSLCTGAPPCSTLTSRKLQVWSPCSEFARTTLSSCAQRSRQLEQGWQEERPTRWLQTVTPLAISPFTRLASALTGLVAHAACPTLSWI